MSDYLRNAWYAAGWSDELAPGQVLARTILEAPIALYRSAGGRPVALQDRCPHRFAPLSRGKVAGEHLVCGYHGLGFGPSGDCVDPRVNSALQARAQVRVYPLVERHRLLWIWMGEATQADSARIPDFSFLDRQDWVVVKGTTHVRSYYLLEIDNLMDLSHIDHLHGDTLSGKVMQDARRTLRQEGLSVHFDTLCAGVPCLPNFEPKVQARGRPTDHWLDLRWDAPGSIRLDLGVTLAGCPRAQGYHIPQGHFLTPETAGTTHYFWILARPDETEPPEHDAMLREIARRAFEDEDRPMLEAVQKRMRGNDFWGEQPLIIPGDEGAIRVRRVLDAAIAAEREPA